MPPPSITPLLQSNLNFPGPLVLPLPLPHDVNRDRGAHRSVVMSPCSNPSPPRSYNKGQPQRSSLRRWIIVVRSHGGGGQNRTDKAATSTDSTRPKKGNNDRRRRPKKKKLQQMTPA